MKAIFKNFLLASVLTLAFISQVNCAGFRTPTKTDLKSCNTSALALRLASPTDGSFYNYFKNTYQAKGTSSNYFSTENLI